MIFLLANVGDAVQQSSATRLASHAMIGVTAVVPTVYINDLFHMNACVFGSA